MGILSLIMVNVFMAAMNSTAGDHGWAALNLSAALALMISTYRQRQT